MNLEEIQRVGRWPVRGLLGQGGFSWVFEVEDENLKVRRALKMLKPEAGEGEGYKRFWREARILASIEDPHLVRILELDRDPGTGNDYYVMELLTGSDLAKLLKDGGPLPLEQANKIFLGVLQGLGRLHEQRPPVIHRDIKPANIQIIESGHAKLLDLGIARMARTGGDETVLGASEITTFAAFMGTVKYASPEQLRVRELGPPSDVFSMGLCLFETLEGRHPYTDIADLPTQSYQDVLGYYAQLEATRGSLSLKFSRTPRPIQALVRKALAIPVADRFANALEMRRALEAAIGGRAPAAPRTAQRRSAKRGALAVVGLGLAVGAGTGLWWWSPWSSAPMVVSPAAVRPSEPAVASRVRMRDLVEAAAQDERLAPEDLEPLQQLVSRADALWDDGGFPAAAKLYDEAHAAGTKLLRDADRLELASAEKGARAARQQAQAAEAARKAGGSWKQAEELLSSGDQARQAGRREEAIASYASAGSAYARALEEAASWKEPVKPVNRPPHVAVSPKGPLHLDVGQQQVLVASASDPEGSRTSVEFVVRNPAGGSSRVSGDRYTFAPKAPGVYKIDVVAKDAAGTRSKPAHVTASVSGTSSVVTTPPAPPPSSASGPARTLDDYADAIRRSDMRRLQAAWRMDAGTKRVFDQLFRSYGTLAVDVISEDPSVQGDSASLRFSQSVRGVKDGRYETVFEGQYLAQLIRRGDYWQITSIKRAN